MYKALSVRCQPCTKKKKNTLRCIVIGACAVRFLHYIPLYRNTQHYATLNCSVKRVYAPGSRKIYIVIMHGYHRHKIGLEDSSSLCGLYTRNDPPWKICLQNEVSKLRCKLDEMIDLLRQRLCTLSARLRRYKRASARKEETKSFGKNEKRFYHELSGAQF